MMIEEEQSVYEDNRGADSLNDSATEFLMDFGSVFSEDVMSVFVMEAAAEIFIDGLQKDQSEAGGGYGWLRRIFALSYMYDRLSSCCRSVRMKPGKQKIRTQQLSKYPNEFKLEFAWTLGTRWRPLLSKQNIA